MGGGVSEKRTGEMEERFCCRLLAPAFQNYCYNRKHHGIRPAETQQVTIHRGCLDIHSRTSFIRHVTPIVPVLLTHLAGEQEKAKLKTGTETMQVVPCRIVLVSFMLL